jgi:hypothetical protein
MIDQEPIFAAQQQDQQRPNQQQQIAEQSQQTMGFVHLQPPIPARCSSLAR